MKNFLRTFILACSMAACQPATTVYEEQDRRFRKDYQVLLHEISAMLEHDQDIRLYRQYGTTSRPWIDSLEAACDRYNISLDSLSERVNFSGLSQAQKDSMDRVITALNIKHTERMIALIHTYGYPAPARIDTGATTDPMLLLEHGDWGYKDTVMKLLAAELQRRRIDSASYELIRWNMNGREGFPAIPGVTIIHQHKDGSADTIQKGE